MGSFANAYLKSQETTEDRIDQLMDIAEKAKLKEESESIFKRATKGTFSLLKGALDIIQRPNFAVATAVKNTIDDDDATTFAGGIIDGLSGKSKDTFTDVFTEMGWNPETKTGKFAKGVASFASDVFLDPTTYLTLGVGAGAKLTARGAKKATTLTKEGTKVYKKLLTLGGAEGLSKKLGKDALLKMTAKNSALAKKWIDKGGIKFFGETLVEGEMIARSLIAIPGMKTIDKLTAPARNALGSMFDRGTDATLGKLPREWMEFEGKIRSLSKTNVEESVKRITDFAQVNKMTVDEAKIINRAIDTGQKIADVRLEKARQFFEKTLGQVRKSEIEKGLKVKEVKNYVPRILNKDKSVPDIEIALPWAKDPARLPGTLAKEASDMPGGLITKSQPGFTKGRKIMKYVDEEGKEFIASSRVLGVKKVPKEKLVKDIENRTKKLTGLLQDRMDKMASPEINAKLGDTKKLIDNIRKQLVEDVAGVTNQIIDKTKVNKKVYDDVIEGIIGPKRRELETELAKMEQLLKADVGEEFLSKPLPLRNKIKDARQKKIIEINDKIVKLQNESLEKIREVEAFDFITAEGRKLNLAEGGGKATINEINETFGKDFFKENIIETAAIRSVASEKAKLAKDFFKEAIQTFGQKADNAPSNYVSAAAKELDGYVFHPSIAKRMDRFRSGLVNDEATSIFLREYDNLLNIWKGSVTSMFPAFHGRNAISNVALNFTDIGAKTFDPAMNTLSGSLIIKDKKISSLEKMALKIGDDGIKAQKELSKRLGEIVVKDDYGVEYSMGALRAIMKKNDIAFRGDRISEITDKVVTKTGGKVEKLKQLNPLSSDFFAVKMGREVGSVVEDHARILNFLTNLNQSGDVMTAAAKTKQTLFDYSNLSAFEKDFMKRIFPFYTFCVPDYSEILTKNGWKKYNEIKKGDEVLSFNIEKGMNEWDEVKEIHTFEGKYDLQSISNKRNYEFLATQDHRWAVQTTNSFVKNKKYGGEYRIKKGNELNTSDRLILSAETIIPKETILSEKESAALGWIVTDGYFRWKNNSFEAMIYQSPKKYAQEIRELLGDWCNSESIHPDTGVICFRIKTKKLNNIKKYFKDKNDLLKIITRLNKKCLVAMEDAMFKAEGCTSGKNKEKGFNQNKGPVIDSYQIINQLLGKSFNISTNKNNLCTGYIKNNNRMKISDSIIDIKKYKGIVWCPVTNNGTWIMRQNGKVVVTGNTRKNLEGQARAIMKTPGRVSTQVKSIDTIGDMLTDSDRLTEEEKKNLPEWMQKGLMITSSRDGSKISFISGFGLPIEQALSLEPKTALDMLSPLLKFPIEKMTGRDLFREKDIKEVTNAESFQYAPDIIKNFIGYREIERETRSGDKYTMYLSTKPNNMHTLINLPPTSRMWTVLGQISREDVPTGQKVTQQLTGLKVYEADLELEAEKKQKELEDELQDLLINARVGSEFETFYISKDNKKKFGID